MLFILTLTFIQGNININNKNNTVSVILETVQIKFAVKIVRRLNVYIIFSQSFKVTTPSQTGQLFYL